MLNNLQLYHYMHKLTQDQLPRHVCEKINDMPVDHLFQVGKVKWSKILVIWESPALNWWILSGKAFYTTDGKLVPSGKRFNELFARFWFGIEDVWFTELCKCVLWPRRDLLVSCWPKCRWHLCKQLEEYDCKIIIVLGVHTLGIMNKVSWKNIPVAELSKQEINGREYTFLPLYHPSPINPRSKAINQAIVERNYDALNKLFDMLKFF